MAEKRHDVGVQELDDALVVADPREHLNRRLVFNHIVFRLY